ncbi:MAG: LapA family protein [Pseudomonadota bacterium]
MFYIRVGFWAALAIVLLTIALANRGPVTFNLLPTELGGLIGFNWAMTVPLYLVILVAIVGGLAIGYMAEWLREYRYRSTASREHRELERLKKEVSTLKVDETKGDDVLALIDGPSRT